MVLDVDKQINLYQHGEGDGDEGKIYKEKNHRKNISFQPLLGGHIFVSPMQFS